MAPNTAKEDKDKPKCFWADINHQLAEQEETFL